MAKETGSGQTMANNPLVGVWRLLSWVVEAADGEISHPLGEDARGYIIYTSEGFMSVSIMRAGRPCFAVPEMVEGTVEEKVAAVEGYMTYCGRYELRERSVIHKVELNTLPNRVGTRQERFFEVGGGRLVLTSPPRRVGGRTVAARLTWEGPLSG